MAINLRSTMLATICSLGLSQITTSILSAQQRPPDLSKLSSEQQEMIASACNVARQFNRPAKYYRCLRDQLGALRNSSGEPDLSDLSPEQQEMIASACNVEIGRASGREGGRACGGCGSVYGWTVG